MREVLWEKIVNEGDLDGKKWGSVGNYAYLLGLETRQPWSQISMIILY